ncbi:hypothetical protein Bbelb_344250 [Branchiostoma belcheri]|nr:hypothetical protein Bbelb_344250 [Branchiostoma belcheri]
MSSQTLSEPHWATPPNILPRQDVHRCRQKVVRDKDETSKTPEMNIIQHGLVARTITPAAAHGKVVHDENQLVTEQMVDVSLKKRTITPAAAHGKVVHDENQLVTEQMVDVSLKLLDWFVTENPAYSGVVRVRSILTAVQPLGNPDFGDCATGSCPCKESADEADVLAVCWPVRRQKGPRDSADPRSQILLEKFTAGGMSEAQQSPGKDGNFLPRCPLQIKCRQSVCASWSAGVPQARNAADIISSQSSTDTAESVPENFGNFLSEDTTSREAVVDKHEGHERRSCARRRGSEKAGGDGDLDLGLGIPTWIGATVVPYSTTAEQLIDFLNNSSQMYLNSADERNQNTLSYM